MSVEPITDAELVARALAGSQDAYHDLVRRFEKPVMSLILRMVQDPAQAEDLAQESFVKAFRNLRTYDPGRKFASWLFKIAHNTTIDHLRRRSPETVAIEENGSLGGDDGGPREHSETLRAPEALAPDRVIERSQVMAGLEAAIAELRPRYREVLLLRFREGLAYQEIAEVTGLPIGTVKIHLHRARKQLAEAMAELGFGM
ncbi:MAG: sigma-70 family RNA polymerase sigma factor [bacterium]|nr:sigma-70 family RNA polymerase sigma factor [bacterium]